mgnify:CR=1 FL=1
MRVPEVLDNPQLLEEDYAMDTALWFFKKNNLWKICDEGVNDDTIKNLKPLEMRLIITNK